MVITAELSLYPLTEAYEEVVIDFIRALRENSKIQTKTSGSSTLIVGESHNVFEAVQATYSAFMERQKGLILVVKYLNNDVFDDPQID